MMGPPFLSAKLPVINQYRQHGGGGARMLFDFAFLPDRGFFVFFRSNSVSFVSACLCELFYFKDQRAFQSSRWDALTRWGANIGSALYPRNPECQSTR